MADIKKIRVQNVDYDIVDAGAARIEDIPVGEIDIELTETSISDGNVTLDISGKQDQLTAGKNIKIIDNVISAEGGGTISSLITPITYVKLKELRNAGKLIPGMQYRITDYSTETAQAETQSAGHNFNIIVTADSETTLNENARAFPAAREFRSYLDPNDEDYFLQPVIFYKQFIDDIGDYGEEEVQNHSSKAISFVDYYSENGKYFLVADDPYGDWSGDEYEYIDIFNLAGKNFGR